MNQIMLTLLISLAALSAIAKVNDDEIVQYGGWQNTVDYINEGVDNRTDPCTSFYQYSCGNWVDNNKRFKDEHEKGKYMFKKKLSKLILEVNSTEPKTKTYARDLREFFDQCMSSKFDDSMEIIELVKAMYTLFGPLPFFQSNDTDMANHFDAWEASAVLHRSLRTNYVFIASVKNMAKGCDYVPTLLIEPLYDFSSIAKDEKLFEPTMRTIAEWANVTYEQAEMAGKLADLKELRKALRRVSMKQSPEIRVKLAELKVQIPEVPWDSYFGILLDDFWTFWNKTNPDIVVREMQVFREMPAVLAKFDKITLYNFAYWQVFRTSRKLLEQQRPKTADTDRKAGRCLEMILKHMLPNALRLYFDTLGIDVLQWKYEVDIMMQSVLSAFRYLVAGLDWLDSREKTVIMKKVSQIRFDSGIPDWIVRDDMMEVALTSELEETSLFEYDLLNEQKNFIKEIKQLFNTLKKVRDPDPIFEHGAYYTTKNIEIRLGFVLPPFYHIDDPLPKKYGTLGWIVAHELMHAFDSLWLLSEDIVGVEKPLFSNDTIKTFQVKTDCLIKQYSRYCYKDLKQCVRGKKTIDDNIADVNGLKIAYLAYKFSSQMSKNKNDTQPPSRLEVSNDKLFFLSAGRLWCGTGDETSVDIRTDVHAPRHARVDVSMKNFPTFAETFKCPIGSRLAPIEICSLWGDVVEPI